MEKKFVQDLRVNCYDTDVSQFLRPSAFMDYAQEIANRHAQELGFGYDDLLRTRTAWVLSRMQVKFLEHPRWRDEVVLSTWHKGAEGLFFLRDFQMDTPDGRPLVLATSSWLVINLETRHLTREVSLDPSGCCPENAIVSPCGKVRVAPGTGILAASHRVSYSDVDFNGHANNVRYLVWAMDALDPEWTSAHPLKEMKINFNHETVLGQEIRIYVSESSADGGKVFLVEGRIAGDGNQETAAFAVELDF